MTCKKSQNVGFLKKQMTKELFVTVLCGMILIDIGNFLHLWLYWSVSKIKITNKIGTLGGKKETKEAPSWQIPDWQTSIVDKILVLQVKYDMVFGDLLSHEGDT